MSMPHRSFWLRLWIGCLSIWLAVGVFSAPAWAAIDPYVIRYLRVTEPIPLVVDEQGQTQSFSAEALSAGKKLFEENCLTCHVGGTTLPDPTISLSLSDLHGATPPRDTINGLVAYLRQPMLYDGSEETFWCRQVPESWLAQTEIENLAGFVLKAAQTAPGWGTETFTEP